MSVPFTLAVNLAAMLTIVRHSVCALGNRPAGSKWIYTTCFLVFAICQGILLYSIGFTIYVTVPKTTSEWKDVKSLWDNETLRSLGLSFASTYGLYLISSIIFLTPWHMLTSFVQYMFLLVRTSSLLAPWSVLIRRCRRSPLTSISFGSSPSVISMT